MAEKNVKGTMLLDFVRMIRAHKTLDWDKHLKPEDWEIINSIVLPAKWYSLDFYLRCAKAAFVLLAKSDLAGARANGQMMAKNLFENTYKSMVLIKDSARALNQFVLTYGSFFNFSTLTIDKAGPKHVLIFHTNDVQPDGNIAYCHQLMGMFETLVQMTGGKNCHILLSAKQWEGAPKTIFDITWI